MSYLDAGFFKWYTRGLAIPNPPYAVFTEYGINVLPQLPSFAYDEGLGPSAESNTFYVKGDGMTDTGNPLLDIITVTFANTNFELYYPTGATWNSATFTIPYTAGTINLAGFKVRMKAGLSEASYTGTITISAPNTTPFVLSLSGDVIANPYFLSRYPGASVAFALNLLSSTYIGDCIRVRRSSDNTEQDIGFNGIELDSTSLLSFCGAGDGFIVTWYDQSGNGNNLTQSVALSQFKIVDSGSILSVNSKYAINFRASGSGMDFDSALSSAAPFYWNSVINRTSGQDAFYLLGGVGLDYTSQWLSSGEVLAYGGGNQYLQSNSTVSDEGQKVLSTDWTASTKKQYLNGIEIPSTLNTLSANTSTLDRVSGSGINSYVQFCIYYNSDQSSNRASIEAYLISIYGI